MLLGVFSLFSLLVQPAVALPGLVRTSSRVAELSERIAEAGLPVQDLPTATIKKRATVTGHAVLAAASGMKPAPVASLLFPNVPMSNAESAKYIKDNWKTSGSISQFVDFIRDPLGGTDIVLRVTYPRGSYSKIPGGAGFYLDVFGDTIPLRSLLSYQVSFSPNFNFVKGGKLPGLYGGDHVGGCSGGRQSDLCFSLRVLWRAGGAGEIYSYLPGTYPGFCDSALVSCSKDGFGTSLGRDTWNYGSAVGAWGTVVESVVLNSEPGINGAGTAKANGYISTYFNPTGQDAKLAFQKKGVVFRTRPDVGFSLLHFSTFFGGSTIDYASTDDVYAYFKDFNIYVGTGDSNASGNIVTMQ